MITGSRYRAMERGEGKPKPDDTMVHFDIDGKLRVLCPDVQKPKQRNLIVTKLLGF